MKVKGFFSRVTILLVSVGWIVAFLIIINSRNPLPLELHMCFIILLLIFNIIFNLIKRDISENAFLIQLIIGLLGIKYWLTANIVFRATLPPRPVSATLNMFLIYSLVAGLVFLTNYYTMLFKTRDIKFNCFKLIELVLVNLVFIITVLFIFDMPILYILAIIAYVLWLKKRFKGDNKKV